MKKYLIKVNGNQYEVEVEEVKSESAVVQPVSSVSASAPALVKAAPAAPAAPKVDTAVPQGVSKIIAPMPGTILRVFVNVGDVVKQGQILLTFEAMKMENEMTAPFDGKVASVNVATGTVVSVGDVMLSIAK